jgi:hypothetical protein
VAVLGLAAASGFDAHTLSLAWALADFLRRQGDWHELAGAWHAALNAANRLGDLREQENYDEALHHPDADPVRAKLASPSTG